ncbi:helix-turn-helix domain-containing protein [Xenorhabdus sp. DI]|uniref:helix-turn-helix domain-containing protein n=1 Tax=Xenorhabdus doucetiae TaxID=351671 RepID=UPI0019A634D7|nr:MULTISPECIES: helix-turn-helix domain-containing protein [unclassified Xenorhabdus]MBD2783068.1 helix-turn-helix domain-containing protein [Xenorhabdus sp. 3]MBD2788764.1 helix-turn-helix domain-containing protein [Xenorhabdus sp. DI]MBD2795732.1 helix-turn-helix domain-containing protein [Xenorhabdus sp. 18]
MTIRYPSFFMWKALTVNLSTQQQYALEHIVKSRTSRSDHRQRAQMILLFASGVSNNRAAKQVGLGSKQAGCWRKRWLDNQDKLNAIESTENTNLNSVIKALETLFSDLHRSGSKPKFTAEQVAQILTVACEEPQASEYPLSHWTLPSLRREVIKRGIVDNISTSRLHVFLKCRGAETA